MTPKERAIELRFKYWKDADLTPEQAQRCALIAVDEILNNSTSYNAYDGVVDNEIWADDEYWLEVKKELEKLDD